MGILQKLHHLWKLIVTEYQLRMLILPPTYPETMKTRLKQILGREYELLAWLYGIEEED